MAFALAPYGASLIAQSLWGSAAGYYLQYLYLNAGASGDFPLVGYWGSPAGGVVSLSSSPALTAGANGVTITAVTLVGNGANVYATLTAGIAGSGADVILDSLTISAVSAILNLTLKCQLQAGNAKLNMALRQAICTALTSATAVNFLTTTANTTISFYSGSPPADCDAAVTGTLLASKTISQTSFNSNAAPTANMLHLTSATSITPVATGTIGYMRMVAANGCAFQTASIGVSTGDVRVTTMSLVSGTAFTLNDLDIMAG